MGGRREKGRSVEDSDDNCDLVESDEQIRCRCADQLGPHVRCWGREREREREHEREHRGGQRALSTRQRARRGRRYPAMEAFSKASGRAIRDCPFQSPRFHFLVQYQEYMAARGDASHWTAGSSPWRHVKVFHSRPVWLSSALFACPVRRQTTFRRSSRVVGSSTVDQPPPPSVSEACFEPGMPLGWFSYILELA